MKHKLLNHFHFLIANKHLPLLRNENQSPYCKTKLLLCQMQLHCYKSVTFSEHVQQNAAAVMKDLQKF